MQGNGADFKSRYAIEAVIASAAKQSSFASAARLWNASSLALLAMTAKYRRALRHHFPSALAIPFQISSLISVAGGLGITAVGPVRFRHASTRRKIHTSPSV
jgi:hypothetical protein